ncbi:MAG: PilZ domain-containing protein [Chakrabartia sp.]
MSGPDPCFEDDPATRGLRNEGRDTLFLQAAIRVLGGLSSEPARVRNLSPSGLMAETGVVYAVGTPVVVDLKPIGPLSGRVVWALDNRMGIALDNSIDPKAARQNASQNSVQRPFERRPWPTRRPGLKLG